MARIAIHGFGRIGRSTLKAALTNGLFVPVSISDIKDLPTLAALFAVDTNYGRWPQPVTAEDGRLCIGEHTIRYLDSSRELPDWAALGVEVVVDCTGRATTRVGAQAHLDRGARTVLVSAPSKSLEDCDAVLLRGINLEDHDPARHRIVSMASCTTNALAPVVKVLNERFGIAAGFSSTVHAYTNTQSLTDQPMRDRRDCWAAAENIIPAASGAAKALKFIWPDLQVTGKAYRVPVRTGSIVELNALVGRATSREGPGRLPRGGGRRPAPGRHGGAGGGVGLLPHRRRAPLVGGGPAARRRSGRAARLRRRVVRQRDGLLHAAGRGGAGAGDARGELSLRRCWPGARRHVRFRVARQFPGAPPPRSPAAGREGRGCAVGGQGSSAPVAVISEVAP